MPIIYKKESEGRWLVLWRVTEDASELARSATAREIVEARKIRNDARRREWLAWRAALRTMLPEAQVAYRRDGAPVLTEGAEGFIGVAHTSGMVAVIYSRTEPCAVDIERLDRDFRRAAPRYLSDEEMRLVCSQEPWFPALVWCAKETLYKYAGEERVDLRDEIRIGAVACRDGENGLAGRMTGRVRAETGIGLSFFTHDSCLVACTPELPEE